MAKPHRWNVGVLGALGPLLWTGSKTALSGSFSGLACEAWSSEVPNLQPHIYSDEPDRLSLFCLGTTKTLLDLGQSEVCAYIVRKDNTCGILDDTRFIGEAWAFRRFQYQLIYPTGFVEDDLALPWE
jgi:hypothetical protein